LHRRLNLKTETMYLLLHADSRIDLHDTDDFRTFSLRLAQPLEVLPPGLPPVLHADGTEHVWVNLEWLRAQYAGGDALTAAALQGMIDYAARKGWVRGDPGALRAHLRRE
jgi:hypothetical protein